MPTIFENSKPEISCIYVNYRSARLLESSLASLFRHESDTPFEVIIVNNDQNEQEAIIPIAQKYNATVLEAFHNPGFGTSANTGANRARGEILFFINPDTEWKEPFFESIQKKFSESKDLGAVGVQLVNPKGVPEEQGIHSRFLFPNPFRKKEKKNIEWLSGGALFIPKNIFLSVAGFDENFFMYFEDMDLCSRIQKSGHTLALHQDQELIHFGGQSHRTKKSQKKVYDQSLYRYTRTHWPLWQHVCFRILHPLYRFFFPYGR